MDVTNLLYTPSSFSFLMAILEWLYKEIKNGLEILLESGDRAEKDFEGSYLVVKSQLEYCNNACEKISEMEQRKQDQNLNNSGVIDKERTLKVLEVTIDGKNEDICLKNRNEAGIPPYQLLKPNSSYNSSLAPISIN
ncbi:hypothetical protein Tco_0413674 [Tanacetum coccineum]